LILKHAWKIPTSLEPLNSGMNYLHVEGFYNHEVITEIKDFFV